MSAKSRTRSAVLASRLPQSVPAVTIDRQCGSSQQALHFAAATVISGQAELVVAGGVDRANILVDPGIGFGKSLAENLALLNSFAIFHGLGCPILLGASRKRLIGALSNEAPADQRLGGSLTLALKGADMGAQLIRVHDVPETVQALRVWRGLRDTALAG